MSSELLVFLLLIAAALAAAALLGGRLLGSRADAPAGKTIRALLGLAAVAVAVAACVLWSLRGQHAQHEPAAAAAAAPAAVPEEAPRGDPVPTAIAALEDCVVASSPPPPPDGTKASKEQMLAARTAFQQFDAATNSYLKCVDLTIARVTQQFPGATAEELKMLRTLGTGAHNTAVDQEQALADKMNTQVRAFNSKHPPGS
jgi:hypothetical protein